MSHHVFAGCDDVNVLFIVLVFTYFCQLILESIIDNILVDGVALLDACGLPQEVLDEIEVLFFGLPLISLFFLFLFLLDHGLYLVAEYGLKLPQGL